MSVLRNLVLSALLIALGSCTEESNLHQPDEQPGNNNKVRLHITVPEMEQTQTRSGEIANISVATFDQNGNMTDAIHEAIIIEGKYYSTDILPSTEMRRVVVFANIFVTLTDYRNTLLNRKWKVYDPTGSLIAPPGADFEYVTSSLVATKLSTLQALKRPALATAIIAGSTYITANISPTRPMVGMVVLPEIQSGTVIEDAGKAIELVRAAAKFTVVDKIASPDFTMLGSSLGNAMSEGFIFPQSTLPATGNAYTYASGSTLPEILMPGIVPAQADPTPIPATTIPLYGWEQRNTHATPTFVILKATYKGTTGYYRLDLVGPPDALGVRSQLDIIRNYHYQIIINNVQGSGYSSFVEAIGSKGSNLNYEVKVSGDAVDDAHDMVSNGEYYLGMSNSEYVLFSDLNETGKVVVTITHNAPSTLKTPPQVTLDYLSSTPTGMGLSLAAGSGYTISGNTAALDVPNGNVKNINLTMNLSTDFAIGMTGRLTVSVGNLKKTVTIKRKSQLVYFPLVTKEFATSEYVIAERATPADTWLKIGTDATNFGIGNAVQSTGSGIYLKPDAWTDVNSPRPTTDLYLGRGNENGRVKATFRQMKRIDNNGTPPEGVTTYTGVFWKAAQTGERMIRIPMGNESKNLGPWTVAVEWLDSRWSAGDIVIDAPAQSGMPSPTSDLSDLNAEYANMNTDWVASGTSLPVEGDVSATSGLNNYVYFRIGLKNLFVSSEAVPARYAVLLLAYGTPTKVQRIFLRQGEGGDYIREEVDSPRFAVYNVASCASVNNGIFANFPTQTGGFKKWSSSFPLYMNQSGWNADNGSISIANVCPNDYKIPSLLTGAYAAYTNEFSALNSPAVKSCWGYYADGFFDRRAISSDAVASGTGDVAHAGRMFFNSANSHSLFLPAAGRLSATNGALVDTNQGFYWSNTYASGSNAYALVFTKSVINPPSEHHYVTGHAIRCVREPNIGGTNPPGDAGHEPW